MRLGDFIDKALVEGQAAYSFSRDTYVDGTEFVSYGDASVASLRDMTFYEFERLVRTDIIEHSKILMKPQFSYRIEVDGTDAVFGVAHEQQQLELEKVPPNFERRVQVDYDAVLTPSSEYSYEMGL